MSGYHSVYSEHIGRPRRSLWFRPWAVAAAGLVGILLGALIATLAQAYGREIMLRPVTCVIREAGDGLVRTGAAGLTGWCEVRR